MTMEFKIAKNEFLRGLRLAQGIADRKSTMPMLANVLLRTQGKSQLLVAATDLNVSLTAELKSQNSHEGGITLGAKNLFELIANAPGDDVTLKRADNHWAEIRSGKVTYKIVGMPDRDFPRVPDHREATYTTIESAVLREMIDRTLFSVCNDETRFHLNGVYFESDGSKARMVSTDGHRLSKVERTIANGPKLSAGVIIPKKGLLEMKKVLESGPSCKLAIKTPHLFLVQEDIAIAVKLIDAQFPPYEQVIPKDHKKIITVDRSRFVDSLRRASLMSSETRGVKLAATKEGLTITSDNPDMGEVREELDAEYNGDAIAIGFNPKYVVELLGQMASDQITIALGGELEPALVRPLSGDDYLGVVMPMRI
jgi:DNA polymerase III subunit beta